MAVSTISILRSIPQSYVVFAAINSPLILIAVFFTANLVLLQLALLLSALLIFAFTEVMSTMGADKRDVFFHLTAVLRRTFGAFRAGDFNWGVTEHLKGIKERHLFHRIEVGGVQCTFIAHR